MIACGPDAVADLHKSAADSGHSPQERESHVGRRSTFAKSDEERRMHR